MLPLAKNKNCRSSKQEQKKIMKNEDGHWPIEKVSLCLSCSKHTEVMELVNSDLSDGVCGFCGSDSEPVYNPEKFEKLRNLIRGLIRLNFDEDEYNHHWGGSSVAYVLSDQENPIVSIASSDTYIDDFIYRVVEEGGVYPDYDKGICLYAGHGDMGRELQFSIPNTNHTSLRNIELRLGQENFHLVEAEMDGFIDQIIDDLAFCIPEDALWFRARTGVKKSYTETENFQVSHIAVPFKFEEIGALPPRLASPGRTNREGVSVLYLANEIETAVAEIRPHPGHMISVGGFRATRPLKVANFDPPIGNFSSSDKRLDLFTDIFHVGQLLGSPVIPEERYKYAATQLLADILIRRGFDGLKFRSSVGVGKNICIFDPQLFKFDENKSFVRRVDSLQYVFSNVLTAPLLDD